MKQLAQEYGVSRRAIERQLGIYRPSSRAPAVGPQQRRVVQRDTPSSSSSSSAVEPQSKLPKKEPAEAVEPPASKPAEAVEPPAELEEPAEAVEPPAEPEAAAVEPLAAQQQTKRRSSRQLRLRRTPRRIMIRWRRSLL